LATASRFIRGVGERVLELAARTTAPGSVTDADIRMFMLEGKIETPLDRTAEIAAHLQALLEALGQGQDVAVSIDNGSLVTVGLDPQTLQLVPLATAPTPTIAEIAELLAVVVPAAHDLAAAQDLSGVVRDPLVGSVPYWVPFLNGLEASLGLPGAAVEARIRLVDAAFGQYGSLILAQIDTNIGVYLLVDTVNGTVAGPFSSSAPYDARALLATHPEYQDGQTIEYFTGGDCATVGPVVGIWVPGPPPAGLIPRGPTTWPPTQPWPRPPCSPPPPPGNCYTVPPPGACWPPVPPYNPGNPAGDWGNCAAFGGCGPFNYIVVQQFLFPGPPQRIYHVISYYTCPGGVAGCPPAPGCTLVGQEHWWN
jgi:hypothetical protein